MINRLMARMGVTPYNLPSWLLSSNPGRPVPRALKGKRLRKWKRLGQVK